MLCFGANADTINLDWYKDGELYDQTTCEIGQDLDLPVIQPSKHGYDFDGWIASFYRGKFSTWDTVPTDYRSYYPDYTGSTKPTYIDYMVVEDPSGYVKPGMPIQIYNEPMSGGTAFARFVFGATDITLNHNEVFQRGAKGFIIGTNGNQLRITYASEVWKLTPLDVPVIVDGVVKPINEIALQWHYARPSQETLYKEINFTGQSGYEGTWRFSYQSDNWDASGKNGWVAEKYLGGNQ
ncbi:MAG: hypothetical protein IKN73_02945 [Alphaproteobacteria bacterium]|nr:hypothetical protein [Alphaproteobacteria bacterium]